MKDITRYSTDRLMMIYTNVKVAQSIREKIAAYNDTELEEHYTLERNLSKVVIFLELELIGEQHPKMNIFKRYDLLQDAFRQVKELAIVK